jgi:hypothetical protein
LFLSFQRKHGEIVYCFLPSGVKIPGHCCSRAGFLTSAVLAEFIKGLT